MTNDDIAAAFEEVADLLEFEGANAFRVRAYRNAARALRDLGEPVAAIVADPSRQLAQIPNIGQGAAEKIEAMLESGRLAALEELREKYPASLLKLLRIPGLGPKKAAALYHELNIVDLDQLQAACEAEQVRGLKGFGPKSEQQILAGLAIADSTDRRLLWADADLLVQALREHLQAAPIERLEFAGSYRRAQDTVGDIDILAIAPEHEPAMNRLAAFPRVESVIGRGDTKMSVRVQWTPHHARGARSAMLVQVDLRVVPPESFGAAWQYFTGSKEHNVVLRGRARQKNLKVNEYGVFRLDSEERVAGATEAEVYAAVGLPWIPPEYREGREEFDWADADALPELLEVGHIRGDLHMHTTATDGRHSLEQMADAAVARGLEYIAITDHSQRTAMANGLNPQRLRAQWAAIDELRPRYTGRLTILKGIECDILEDGRLDLPDDVLAEADWVVASLHYGQQQSREQITARIVGAIEHPSVATIGHPTGRLLNHRDAYQVDMDRVIEAAARCGKLLEINANPLRLDLSDAHAAEARRRGVKLVIDTDAHSVDGLDQLRFGVLQARRAGLSPADIGNAHPWEELRAMIGRPT